MRSLSRVISIDDVERAARTIAGRVHRTPLLRSATLSEQLGADARFKAELFQRTGSFKARGALNQALAADATRRSARGVISISAGNHAQALAWAAREAGVDALVVMWQGADALKIDATRGYGADGRPGGRRARRRRSTGCTSCVEQTGRTLVHPFDDPAVIAGQGTVGLEILEDGPVPDVVRRPGRRRRPRLRDRDGGQGAPARRARDRASSPSSRPRCTTASRPGTRCR